MSAAIFQAAAAPLTGSWVGTETCVAGPCDGQGVAQAALSLQNSSSGVYTVGTAAHPLTFFPLPARAPHDPHAGAHRVGTVWDGTVGKHIHGSFVMEANDTNLWGSWNSWNTTGRLFQWDFARAPTPQPPPFEMVTLFSKGDYNYSCHRVPAIAAFDGGKTLVVFVESRIGSCSDQAPKDVLMKRSLDGGRTWSAFSKVIGDGFASNHTFRNPYPTAVLVGPVGGREIQRIVLNCANSTLDATWLSLQLVSDDLGRTWSEAHVVTSLEAWSSESAGILGGPGYGIVKQYPPHVGRLLSCGATGYHHDRVMEALVWFSDDEGSTWRIANDTANVLRNQQECQMIELTNGSVAINMRNAHLDPNGCDCRAVSISHDGGATFSPVWYVPELIEPTCSAGLLNLPNSRGSSTFGLLEKDDIFFSNPNSRTSRVNMTVKRSRDSGASWSDGAVVWSGASGYSVLTPIGIQAMVGVVFEHSSSAAVQYSPHGNNPYDAISIAFVPKNET